MANTKSAEKEARTSEGKRGRNRAVKSLCRTGITKAEVLVFSGEVDEAKRAVTSAISALDKAEGKGIIHPNNAARRKSRLMKKLNEALASKEGARKD